MTKELWEAEYQKKGIPSSFRQTPTRIVRHVVEKYPKQGIAMDLGCGKGRNSVFLAENGYGVVGIDFVQSNLDELDAKAKEMNLRIRTTCQSVTEPLPFPANHFDLIIDIFCYKHQIDETDRQNYRSELHRVLKPDGLLVLSLAGKNDGFYGPLLKPGSNVIIDPHTEIASVLFTREEIEKEFSGFQVIEFIHYKDEGPMHGSVYRRDTMGFIMKKRV